MLGIETMKFVKKAVLELHDDAWIVED